MLGREPFLLTQVVIAFAATVSEDHHVLLFMNFACSLFIEKAPEAQAERG